LCIFLSLSVEILSAATFHEIDYKATGIYCKAVKHFFFSCKEKKNIFVVDDDDDDDV